MLGSRRLRRPGAAARGPAPDVACNRRAGSASPASDDRCRSSAAGGPRRASSTPPHRFTRFRRGATGISALSSRGAHDLDDGGERGMCRWMAWHGQPVLIEELLFKTEHGLIDQSLHSRMGAETDQRRRLRGRLVRRAARARASTAASSPAWGDANLRDLAGAHRVAAVPRPRARDDRARRCSRPTATRSATGAGCSSTTA